MADTKIPAPKYYQKWGMPPVPSLKYPVAPRKFYNADNWSFITKKRQRPELHISPKLWNEILHELLRTEDTQATIAGKLGCKRKYVRAVVGRISSSAKAMEKMGMLGPRQAQILARKVKKRQSQSTIARVLGVSKQRVSALIPHLENKFKENDDFRGLGRGGLDSYFWAKAPEPVAAPDVTPDYTPKIDFSRCSQYMKNLRLAIEKRKQETRTVMTDPFYVPNNLTDKEPEDRTELKMSAAVEAFIRDCAEACKVTREEFVENSLVDLMARAHIRSLMRVGPPFGPLVFAIKLDGRLLHDKELFDWLIQYYDEDLGLTALAEMDREAEQKEYMEEFAKSSKVMTKEELEERGKKLLEQGPTTWLGDHSEYDQFKMEQERGRVPAGFDGAPGTALGWLKLFDEGEIDQDMLDELFVEHAKGSEG